MDQESSTDILATAAALIEENGWYRLASDTQPYYSDPGYTPLCAGVSISEASRNNDHQTEMACRILVGHLGLTVRPDSAPMPAYRAVAAWNDTQADKETVVKALRSAAGL